MLHDRVPGVVGHDEAQRMKRRVLAPWAHVERPPAHDDRAAPTGAASGSPTSSYGIRRVPPALDGRVSPARPLGPRGEANSERTAGAREGE
jgi:hypothetical protein